MKVARPAVKGVFRPDGPAADLRAPYLLTVATLEPRKNLQTLVEAHRLLDAGLLLAVVGAEGWGEQPFLDDARIRRLGFVSDEELARLYRGAAAASTPPASRASGSRSSRRWPAAARWSPRPIPRSTRRAETPRFAQTRTTRWRSRRRSSSRSETASGCPRRSRARAGFTWRAVGEIFLRGYQEAAR